MLGPSLRIRQKIEYPPGGQPASEMPFEWHFVGGPMWVRHSVLAGFTCHDPENEKIDR